MEKYARPVEYSASTAADFQDKYGDVAGPMATEYNTAYKLTAALRQLDPPICITDGVAKQWLAKVHLTRRIIVPAKVESEFGERIREHKSMADWTAEELVSWLSRSCSIVVTLRVAQDFLATKWGSDGLLYLPSQVEEALGDRLRLEQYRVELLTQEASDALAQRLQESQPPVVVSGLLLRQWYMKYHPDSGPLRYDTAQELEDAMGERMRDVYDGLGSRALQGALSKARKVVLVTHQVVRGWCDRFSRMAVCRRPAGKHVLKRPAAGCMKRPAAMKRPASAMDEDVSMDEVPEVDEPEGMLVDADDQGPASSSSCCISDVKLLEDSGITQ